MLKLNNNLEKGGAKMRSYRQGDVAFFEIKEVPEGFKEIGTVLEIRGEREGHLHRAENVVVLERPINLERTGQIDLQLDLPVAIIEASKETTVTHPDHPDLALPPGIYEVRQAREHNPNRNRRVD